MKDTVEVCRTCLSPQALGPLFPDPEKHYKVQLAIYLTTSLQVHPKDGLSQFICRYCSASVEALMLFRLQCRIAHARLQQWCNSSLSQEDNALPQTIEIKLLAKSKLTNFYSSSIDVPIISCTIKAFDIDNKQIDDILDKPVLHDMIDLNEIEFIPNQEKLNNVKDEPELVHSTEVTSVNKDFINSNHKHGNFKIKDLCDTEYIHKQEKLNYTKYVPELMNEDLLNSNQETGNVKIKFEDSDIVNEDKPIKRPKFVNLASYLKSKGLTLRMRRSSIPNDAIKKYIKPNYSKEEPAIVNLGRRPDKKVLDLIEDSLSPNELKCKICGVTYETLEAFEEHARTHSGLVSFVCEFCGKGCNNRTSLKRHLQALHGLERDFACPHCDFKAVNKAQLVVHVRKAHTHERPFVCDVCGAAFYSKPVLSLHIRESHTDEKPYQCDECPRRFRVRHKVTHHKKLRHHPTFKFMCHICDNTFCRSEVVRTHFWRVHKIPRELQVEKVHRFYFDQTRASMLLQGNT